MKSQPTYDNEDSPAPKEMVHAFGEVDLVHRSKPYYQRFSWPNVLGYIIIHIAGIYGTYLLFFSAKIITSLWTLTLGLMAGLSITMGAHRLYSHKAFKAAAALRLALNVLQTLTGQHCMWVWVRDHRQHHKYSDTDADPHNAAAGFFFSHMGWLMCYKHPEVIRKGMATDMSDVDSDPFVMFQKRYFYSMYFVFSFLLPVMIPVWAWGEDFMISVLVCFFARTVINFHCTWMVNSYAHHFGNRPYSRDILPVDTGLVSFLTMGEGWHNYHHSFPWDYRAAELGQRLNLTTTLLDLFARWGWVWDLKTTSPETVKEHLLAKGDKSHPLALIAKAN